ncbi:MAG: hypothetical protein R2824_35830 [Saprospiraceae bacterium]
MMRFLDHDGDGSILDDISGLGMKILGGFFDKDRKGFGGFKQ